VAKSVPLLAFLNFDGGDFVAFFDFVNDFLTTRDLTKNRVFAVEMGRGNVRDEELAAVGAGASVGHRQRADLVAVRVAREFVGEFVAGATASGSGRVAALDHKVGDDAVKTHAIIKAIACQKNEVVHGFGRVSGEKLHLDVARVGFEGRSVVFGRVDGHCGCLSVLFGCHNWFGRCSSRPSLRQTQGRNYFHTTTVRAMPAKSKCHCKRRQFSNNDSRAAF